MTSEPETAQGGVVVACRVILFFSAANPTPGVASAGCVSRSVVTYRRIDSAGGGW